jgi:hypothetical protein
MSKDSFLARNVGIILIVIMYIFYSFPVLSPFSLPIETTEKAETFYQLVEDLPDGCTVLVAFDYSPVSYPLFQGLQEGFIRHVVTSKGGKVVMAAFTQDGPMMYRKMVGDFAYLNQLTYGADYCFLGFIPGEETGLTSFMGNIRSVITVDFSGTSLDSLPIMQGVNGGPDFDLVLDLETSTTLGDGFVRQVSTAYGTPLALASSGGQTLEPYYPDQVQGLLYPLPGIVAEYEKLLDRPGNASAQMALLLVGNIWYILVLLAGNINDILGRGSK